MRFPVVRLLLVPALLTLAAAPSLRAQTTLSGGRSNAPRIGFGYSGSPQIGANGEIRFADYPVVTKVDSGSAPQAAGIAIGDVILEVNGHDAREGHLFRDRNPGTRYLMRVRRGTEVREIGFAIPERAGGTSSSEPVSHP